MFFRQSSTNSLSHALCIIAGIIFYFSLSGDVAAEDASASSGEEAVAADPMTRAVVPVPREDFPESLLWDHRYSLQTRQIKARPDSRILWFGDSITQYWEVAALPVWNRFFGSYSTLNLGCNGDRTEHLRWRIQNTDFSNSSPDIAVVMIGTNNSGQVQDPPEATFAGIEAIVSDLREVLPGTRILVLGLLPVHYRPDNPHRLLNNEVNRLLPRLADNHHVYFTDPSAIFVDEQGYLSSSLMPDGVHPSYYGYEALARKLEPTLMWLLRAETTRPGIQVRYGNIYLEFSTDPFQLYDLQYSTDMTQWIHVTEQEASGEKMHIELPASDFPPHSFFRISPVIK